MTKALLTILVALDNAVGLAETDTAVAQFEAWQDDVVRLLNEQHDDMTFDQWYTQARQ